MYLRFPLWNSSSSLLLSFDPLVLAIIWMVFFRYLSLPRGEYLLWWTLLTSSTSLIISGVFNQPSLLDQSFYWIFKLYGVIRVMAVTLMETTILRFVWSRWFRDLVGNLDPSLLELSIYEFFPNLIHWSIQGSVSIEFGPRAVFSFFFMMTTIYFWCPVESKIPGSSTSSLDQELFFIIGVRLCPT